MRPLRSSHCETRLREQLPGPVDGVGLEVVPEAPIAQHLEERVVVHVLAHVVQVVVLAARADALGIQKGTCNMHS